MQYLGKQENVPNPQFSAMLIRSKTVPKKDLPIQIQNLFQKEIDHYSLIV